MKKYLKELYNREVLLKAAYAFTDSMYIHLDADTNHYLVSLETKDGEENESLYSKFENELIAQENRYIVSERTKNIREMIVARSLSSTMIDIGNNQEPNGDDFDSETILKDWFDNE